MAATVITASISELPDSLKRGKQHGSNRSSGIQLTNSQLFQLETAFYQHAGEARSNDSLLAELSTQHGVSRADAQDWFLRRARHANVPAALPGKMLQLYRLRRQSAQNQQDGTAVQMTTKIRSWHSATGRPNSTKKQRPEVP